jgi:PhzF family phenazine biosynthesis protein
MTDVSAFLYESFAAASFGGNIAGVVLLEHPASRSWVQGVAADLGAPTTGFVDLPSARQGCAEVRFFTPHQKIDACGHVTVAIATALAETGTWDPGKAAVQAAGGSYDLLLRRDDHGVIVEMRQQLQHFEALDPAPEFVSILGPATNPDERYLVVVAGTGLRHMLVPVRPSALSRRRPAARPLAPWPSPSPTPSCSPRNVRDSRVRPLGDLSRLSTTTRTDLRDHSRQVRPRPVYRAPATFITITKLTAGLRTP